MEDKNQEALDWIKNELTRGWCAPEQYFRKVHKSIGTLQELIDNYSKLEKAYKRACKDLSDDCCKNCFESKPRGLYESAEEIEKNILKIANN